MLGRVVALAALGGFLFGYDLGLIGGAILGISEAFHISNATKEAIVGAAKLGAFFGTFVGGVCMLRYGRRKAISLQAAFFVAGPALMAAAPGPAALVAGRLLVGLGIGASAIVVPAYLAEIAPAKNRGMVVQMYEVMLTLGMLAAVLVNLGLSAAAGGAAWRWMVGLPAIPGAFLLASLVSLPESPRWLVMRGQLDEALTTLHSIIITSSSSSSSSSRARKRSRAFSRRPGGHVSGGPAASLQQEGSVAADDAAWLNAAPEAGRPRNAEQRALEQAEDELLLLWSSVQKEQAAGAELRQAAAGAAPPNSRRSGAGSSNGILHQPADAQVVVVTTPTATATAAANGSGSGSPRRRFALQMAPAAAFSLDDDEDHHHHHHKGLHDKQHYWQQQQQQEQLHSQPQQQEAQQSADVYSNGDGVLGGDHSSSGGAAARLKALQQKRQLGARGSAGGGRGDADGQQQQLLGPSAINSSSSPASLQHDHLDQQQQWPQQQQQQQQDAASVQHTQPSKRVVQPGQESNVFASLWAMLSDIKAVAQGPERAAFAIACCMAVIDQATASTAIINYAPEVLSNTLGVQDPNLAILYPAAIALAKVVGTLIAAVTVDKYGRKPLLVWGGVGCAVFLGLTGIALGVGSVAMYLAALCLFIFSFSLSWAGLYWVVVSEIFSMGAKSPATSAATSLLFLTGAVVNFMYLSLIDWLGGAGFAIFGVIAALSAWYVWARVPETKGKTLAEIQALLAPDAASSRGTHGTSGVQDGSARRNDDGMRVTLTAGADPGSPMLPITGQQQLPGHAGGGSGSADDSRLVELRQLMGAKPSPQ